jgi:hypothetical protein
MGLEAEPETNQCTVKRCLFLQMSFIGTVGAVPNAFIHHQRNGEIKYSL